MPTLETRVISGKGLLRISKTSDDFKKAKIITVFADVIRPPFNEYLNLNYNPPESRYATLQFMRGGYVIRTEPMKYERQSWDFYPEPAAQTLLAVQCSYQGVLESFLNLGVSLGLPPISFENKIADWQYEDLFFDEIKVVCYADTAIRLVAESTPYFLCPDQQDKEPAPPPPPPIPVPSYDPGEPLENTDDPASPAYDEETDGGDTVPFPGDETPPPPPPTDGEACLRYDVVANIYINNAQGVPVLVGNQAATARVYGIVGLDLVSQVQGNTRFVYVQCQGLGQGPCQVYPTLIQLASFASSSTYRDDLSEIVSVTLVP